MEASLKLSFPASPSLNKFSFAGCSRFLPFNEGRDYIKRVHSVSLNGSVVFSDANKADSHAVVDAHRQRSSLESVFCYDKPILEEIIERPVGLTLQERQIRGNPPCTDCQAKGTVLCATCYGSGIYVDSIMESQGIVVKVQCMGCGGTGNILCSDCGGRGHRGTIA